MIQIEQATAAAFARREIRILPLLTLVDESGNEVNIPASKLLARPSVATSPVLGKSPVRRLDVEIAPDPSIVHLFSEQQEIHYQENINGQWFEKFFGRIQTIEKGWAINNGAVVPSLNITCFSPSQRLADMDVDLFHKNKVRQAVTGAQYRPLTVIYERRKLYGTKASAGNDPVQHNAVWQANGGINAAKITWQESNGAIIRTAFGGSTFKVGLTNTALSIDWSTGTPSDLPPAGASYTLEVNCVVGFVVSNETTGYGGSAGLLPGSWSAYELVTSEENSIEAIEFTNLDYWRFFPPTIQQPFFVGRVGTFGSSAVPTDLPLRDWECTFERGYFRYVGNGAVFDNTSPYGIETTLVGVGGVFETEHGNIDNQAETFINTLLWYADAVKIRSVNNGLEATGITLNEFHAVGKGDVVLRQVLDAVPPNYVLYDDELGTTRGAFWTQKEVADYMLTTAKSLKDKEAPEMITRVVVNAVVQNQLIAPGDQFSPGVYNGGDNWQAAFVDNDTTWAQVPSGSNFFRVCWQLDHRRRFKSCKFRFTGEVLCMIGLDPVDTGLLDGEARLIPGYQHIITSAGAQKTVTITDTSSVLSQATRYNNDSWLILEFRPVPGATTKCFYAELFADVVTQQFAELRTNLTDTDPQGWEQRELGWRKQVTPEFLNRWLITTNANRDAPPGHFWWQHRNKVLELGGISRGKGKALAKTHLEDVMRRSVNQEVEVVCEPHAQLGDTVQVHDLQTGQVYNRLIIGMKDGKSFTEPTTVLELANYS